MLEAAQPAAPAVSVFMHVLATAGQPRATRTSMFGTMFADSAQNPRPKGTTGVHKSGSKAAFQFEAVRTLNGSNSESLDEWFADLARFTLEPMALFDDEAKQLECMQQRKALCQQAGVKVRSYKTGSFKTYINGLGNYHNSNTPDNHIVLSSLSQFPETNALLAACIVPTA